MSAECTNYKKRAICYAVIWVIIYIIYGIFELAIQWGRVALGVWDGYTSVLAPSILVAYLFCILLFILGVQVVKNAKKSGLKPLLVIFSIGTGIMAMAILILTLAAILEITGVS